MTPEIDHSSRSHAAAAPDVSARRAAGIRTRSLAAAMLLAMVAGAGSLGAYTWRHRVAPLMHDPSPFPLGDAVWRSVRSVARTSGTSCPSRLAVAVLYVSRSCVHCEAELRRWAGLVRSGAPEIACVAIAVVAPHAGTSPANDWLPAELANALLWDRDGLIARALDARLVPLAAFVTPAGIVRVRAVGESSAAATLERFRTVRWLSNIEPGGH